MTNKCDNIEIPVLITAAQSSNKFKRIIYEKLNRGQYPLFNIKAGDEALGYDPYKKAWLFAPTQNMFICRDEDYKAMINRDRRCSTRGLIFITDIQFFKEIINKIENCEDRELLIINYEDNPEFGLLIKDIYENNPKYTS